MTVDHPRAFGSDRIVRKGGQILVYTGSEMPDWQVRIYRRIAVVLDDRVYFVAQKEDIDRRTIRYTLEPWPETLHDLPGRTIHYSEEYVRQRDRSRSNAIRREAMFHSLRLFKPLIGFLPSSVKYRIEVRYGISARGATVSSLWLELVAFFAVGVVNWIATFANLEAAANISPISGLSSLSFRSCFFSSSRSLSGTATT